MRSSEPSTMTQGTTTMTRSAAALRLLVGLVLVAAVIALLASLLAASVSAAPTDDVVADTDDLVVVDDATGPTETPVVEVEPELTPVAIPSVSPVPTDDPFDVTGDLPEEVYDDPGTGDLILTSEVCDPLVPGQVSDQFCSPSPSSGYDAYLYAGTSNQNYTVYYQGALPVDLLDVPGGSYMLSAGPIPPLMQLKMVCRVENGAGTLIDTLTGSTFITFTAGYDRVYRCVVYLLPEGELPDELAPDVDVSGPVEVIVTDYLCPAGTDPSLNYFGLIGRCSELADSPRWAAYGAAGGSEVGDQIEDGTVSMTLTGGVWTLETRWPTGDHAPILFCNVRDKFFQEPPQYAPFMTYQHGATGAVMTLEQNMTWLCAAYFVPAAAGDGSDVAEITVTKHLCPEGTTAPSVSTCAQTVYDIPFHLLYGTQTIVATRATDANGVVAFAGPENLGSFGLAEDVPGGFVVAPYALCSENGGAPIEVPVIAGAVVDLGSLAGGDTVDCAWFNVVDSSAVATVDLDLEIADVDDRDLVPDVDSGRDAPQDDAGEDAVPTATPKSDGMVPLEADE